MNEKLVQPENIYTEAEIDYWAWRVMEPYYASLKAPHLLYGFHPDWLTGSGVLPHGERMWM